MISRKTEHVILLFSKLRRRSLYIDVIARLVETFVLNPCCWFVNILFWSKNLIIFLYKIFSKILAKAERKEIDLKSASSCGLDAFSIEILGIIKRFLEMFLVQYIYLKFGQETNL